MTVLIVEIRRKFAEENLSFLNTLLTNLSCDKSEFKKLGRQLRTVKSYPEDKYGPSCLICGLTQAQRPVHVQCSYPSRSLIKIITVYEPDPQRWNDDFTQRRFSDDDN